MTSRQHNQRQALLVIGMHRSGTSALTRVINLHGITLGSKLMEPVADNNEAGFWENQHVMDLHERLLADLGTSWDDPRELPQGWLDKALAAGYLDQLVTLITTEFGDTQIWAVKDPRLCRLLPLWMKALACLDIEPKLVFALRHPAEVVGSLMRRDDLSAAAASLLWLRHLTEPVHASGTLLRCVVDYDELLSNWRTCMDRIAFDLAVEWPVSSQACAVEVDAHLRHDLRHQHSSATQGQLPSAWRDLLLEVHAAGLAVARGNAGWGSFELKLDMTMAHFGFARPLIADLLPKSGQDRLKSSHAELQSSLVQWQSSRAELQSSLVQWQSSHAELQSSHAQLQSTLAQLQSQLVELNWTVAEQRREAMQVRAVLEAEIELMSSKLDLITSSRSWRWTRPMRVMWRTIGNHGLSAEDRLKLKRSTRDAP